MDNFSDFDAQFEQTLALVNGPQSGGDEGSQRDPNQFRPSVSEKKTSYNAILRFIPPANGPMFVKKVVHFMNVGGKKVRVICPKTVDPRANCDICSDNIQGHRSKVDALVARAKDQGNKTRWVANVLVLEDSVNPENIGRVLWWEFPNSIMEFIEKLKNPPAAMASRIPSINAFHPTKGADFSLVMNHIDNYTKYDGSQFLLMGGPTAIGDDAYIAQVRSMCHDIQSQIVIPTQEEITEILVKSGSTAPMAVQKSYANIQGGYAQAPQGPAVSGFGGGFSGGNGLAPAQVDEFDAMYANSGVQAPQVAQAQRPQLAQAAPAPKPAMAVPSRPTLQTAESVMPSAEARVTPMPQAPAQVQPHSSKPVDDVEWYQ